VSRCVEQTPIGADATFRGLPRLVDRFDDIVVDAECVGARHEIAQHGRLFEAARNGIFDVIARAWPAKLGDHDALAGIHLAQPVVAADRVVDGGSAGFAFPVRQNVNGDVVDRRDKLRMVLPHLPGFTGGDRHLRLALDALDDLDQPRDVDGFQFFLVIARPGRSSPRCVGFSFVGLFLIADENRLTSIDRFVADHDRVDIRMLAGKIDHCCEFALIARGALDRVLAIFGKPRAGRDLQAVFVGDTGNE
jgi:hypothetical protein